MVNKISLGNLSVPSNIISRIKEIFTGSSDAVAKKPWGEPPPKVADISNNPLLMAMFGGQGLLERLKRKLKRLSGKGAKFIPAHGTIAMANQKEGIVYVGVEFLEENFENEETIAGVLAHEWGHLIEDLPPGFDPELLSFDQLWELRREKEAEADAYAGKCLHSMGFGPAGFVNLLKSIKSKYQTQKYFDVPTRVAIIETAFAKEKQRVKSFDQLKSGQGQSE